MRAIFSIIFPFILSAYSLRFVNINNGCKLSSSSYDACISLSYTGGKSSGANYTLYGLPCFPTTGISEKKIQFPRFGIKRIYPNPVKTTLKIEYVIEKAGEIKFMLYDISGRKREEIRHWHSKAGLYRIEWQLNLPEGIYFLKIQKGEKFLMKKIILM